MRQHAKPITLAGSELGHACHVCALFSNDEEEYRVLLPFMRDCVQGGDRAVHVINPEQRSEDMDRLAPAGIDSLAAQQSGQLELRANTDAHLREGRFAPDLMPRVFEGLAGGDPERGFPFSRLICRVDRSAEGRTHLNNLIGFESRINSLWSRHDDAVSCTYHMSQFSGDSVTDIVRTYPVVIVGGILQVNPFFAPPEQFLPEFRARSARDVAPRVGA